MLKRLTNKKNRNKIAVICGGVFVVAAIFCFVPNLSVLAQTPIEAGLGAVGDGSGLGTEDIRIVIARIIRVALGFLGIIAVILVLYAGFLWMIAGGDQNKIDKAKAILTNALIGLIIILSSLALTQYVLSRLMDATGVGISGVQGGGAPAINPLSGSLGAGIINDHYPARDATDIARNTRIIITFNEEMMISSFIAGYDDNGTPLDIGDDPPGQSMNLNTDNVFIYTSSPMEGEPDDAVDRALDGTEVEVGFTDDLTIFVFDPPVLGSPDEDVWYTVNLGTEILKADGEDAFTGAFAGGYEWEFECSTELDMTPPKVSSVVPEAEETYARNILISITFNEAIDPTSSTGTIPGFTNIEVVDEVNNSQLVSGTWVISNAYKTVEFTTEDACGENSCGETIYCLPESTSIATTARSATTTVEPPQADFFPYDGVVDVAGNSLDGNEDGEGDGPGDAPDYDNYEWVFDTNDEIVLDPPEIEAVLPEYSTPDVTFDQDVIITWGQLMSISSLSTSNIGIFADPEHELWYSIGSRTIEVLDAENKTEMEINHGILVAETLYYPEITSGVRSAYQNCFYASSGPDCVGNPYCCDGSPDTQRCGFLP